MKSIGASGGTMSPKKKRNIIIISCVAVFLAAAIVLAIVLPIVLRVQEASTPHFSSPANLLPTEEMYALDKYEYDELSDVKVTMRADTMNVTKRDLARPVPEVLSDDFSLVYDEETKELQAVYGELVQSSGKLHAASVSFNPDAYPSPSKAMTSAAYAQAAAAAGVSEADYFAYVKYMLMTQGQHLAVEAQQMSANGTLTQEWLKKHPAADAQYGAVLGENNAVEKEITLDPLYRSYHATGLYLPAGELVTVKVEGLKPGENISIVIGRQNSLAWRGSVNDSAFNAIAGSLGEVKAAPSDAFFIKADVLTAHGDFYTYNHGDSTPFLQSQWKRQNARAPWITAEFVFNGNGEYKIGTAFGGVMHINPRNCYSQAKATVTGAVETPHYILGVTTPEYFDEYLRDAPGVIGVIDTENGQLIGPTGEMGTGNYMRRIEKDEADKLAMLWHSFFSVNESFTGGTYNRPNQVLFDWHVPAGAAVALGGYVYACPTGWFGSATNYRGLLAAGSWGILHEIGHNHASSYGTFWGFGDGKEGEVHNNALTTLAYLMFCDIGTMRDANGNIPAEHGFVAHPYSALTASLNTMKKSYTDYSQNDYFEMLNMYANIMHSFGAEKFYELLYTYKASSAYLSNKRADFTYRCALIYGMDFRTYFNKFYKANLADEQFVHTTADGAESREYLELVESLPVYEPVASYYAGGIDGVKTGGDYRVAFGDYITFDLLDKTVSGLDTADGKGFDIIKVDSPEHGSITDLGGGKYRYFFDAKYTGAFDVFSYYVKMKDEDGLVHKLDVSLRISYNGARVSVYSGITDPGVSGAALIENLESVISQMTPEYETSTVPGVGSYNTSAIGQAQVRVADFWWQAPVSGEVAVSVFGSNTINFKAGPSFDALTDTGIVFTGGLAGNTLNAAGNAVKFKYVMNVNAGQKYAFRVYSTNIKNVKANADARIAIFKKNGDIVAEPALTDERFTELYGEGARFDVLPLEQITHVALTGEPAPQYVYEPKFIVSKKDSIKLSTTGTDKSEWSVLKAPTDIQDGRYAKTTFIDPDPDSETYGQVIDTVEVDKWTYLIDGVTGTILHTRYTGSVPQITAENPHEFIIDTSGQQQFNYFSVTTRSNVNSYMTAFEMQISSDYDPETGAGTWTTVGEGDRSSYVNNTVTMRFPQTYGRYLRLLVKGTTGGTFSVLAEIDAGIMSSTQRVIAPTSSMLYTTKYWENSDDLPSEPSGYIVSSRKNSKAVVRFYGNSFALYAATGEEYGKINIKVDGKSMATVDLDSKTRESRKLVFNIDQLTDKEHTVEIITLNSGKVMLNVIGIPYGAQLLNAPNIYLEHNLTVALVVFVLLFAALLALVLCMTLIPKFRNAVFGNKVMKKYDESVETKREQKKAKANEEKAKIEKQEPPKKPTPQEMVAQRLRDRKSAESVDNAGTGVSTESRATAATPKSSAAKETGVNKPTGAATKPQSVNSATTRNNAAARAAEIAKQAPARPVSRSAPPASKNTPPARPSNKK